MVTLNPYLKHYQSRSFWKSKKEMVVSKKFSVYLTGEGLGEKQRSLRIGVRLNNRLHRCYFLKLSDIHGVHQYNARSSLGSPGYSAI